MRINLRDTVLQVIPRGRREEKGGRRTLRMQVLLAEKVVERGCS